MSSGAKFDPYHVWLGIAKEEQPPHHYRLLGLSPFEDSLDVIENAADRQMAHLRAMSTGKHRDASQKLLNEISAARVCLLNPEERAQYDKQLQASLAKQQASSLAVAKPVAQPAVQPAFPKLGEPTPRSRVKANAAPKVKSNHQPQRSTRGADATRRAYEAARQRKKLQTMIVVAGAGLLAAMGLVVMFVVISSPEKKGKSRRTVAARSSTGSRTTSPTTPPRTTPRTTLRTTPRPATPTPRPTAPRSTAPPPAVVTSSEAPPVSRLLSSTGPIVQGESFQLAAHFAADSPTIEVVSFYLDADDDGKLDPNTDRRLGVDDQATDGWNVEIHDAELSPGVRRFFAQPRDGNQQTLEAVVALKNVVGPALIIDNDSPTGFEETGPDWETENFAYAYGGNQRHTSESATLGEHHARWTFTDLKPDARYHVLACWWSQRSAGNTVAPFEIFDGEKRLGSMQVDQGGPSNDLTAVGKKWESLGVYRSTTGSFSIHLSNRPKGSVAADAIRLVEVLPPVDPVWQIDDGDPYYEQIGEGWRSINMTAGFRGDQHAFTAPASSSTTPSAMARWTFGALDPQRKYAVYIRWHGMGVNQCRSATYTLLDDNQEISSVPIDQTRRPSEQNFGGRLLWDTLGEVSVPSGTLVVRLTPGADGTTFADAVRIVELAPPPDKTPPVVAENPDQTTPAAPVDEPVPTIDPTAAETPDALEPDGPKTIGNDPTPPNP